MKKSRAFLINGTYTVTLTDTTGLSAEDGLVVSVANVTPSVFIR